MSHCVNVENIINAVHNKYVI